MLIRWPQSWRSAVGFNCLSIDSKHVNVADSLLLSQTSMTFRILLHAVEKLHFDDVRPEEWTPSYAGNASKNRLFAPRANGRLSRQR